MSVDGQLVEWGPGKTARGRARLPSSRRRERPQLSCVLCRRRKLRCDRQQPCGACSHRGLGPSCTYAPGEPPMAAAQQRPATVQDRIQRLENLVVDLMQKTSACSRDEELPTSPFPRCYSSSSSPPPPSECGSLRWTEDGAGYVSSAHWAAILDGITELKTHLQQDDGSQWTAPHAPADPFVQQCTGPRLLYGGGRKVTREELLAAIPPRVVVDRLISRYFNSFELSPAVLHSGQFLKEYEEFWDSPSTTPIIWLGLLFTLMCLATQFQKFRMDPNAQPAISQSTMEDLQQQVERYRHKIVECLVLGDYAKGGPYVLETLMLYVAVELFLHSDAQIGIWLLLGTVVQLAMHMGYHRDPRHFPAISPFAGEMRKRVWATVVEMDLGASTQMGLPRLVKQWQADTGEPSNLHDSDFDQATADLPPSRPETDLTPMLYRLVKARMTKELGYIWDFAADTRPYTHAEVMQMDQRLESPYRAIPEPLRWRSMAHCVMDSPRIIIQKVFLELMYHRSRIVLHRKYLHAVSSNPHYNDSRRACLDAALKLLEYQHVLQEETQPFCQLYQERWRVSSLVNHDFLLATSILCLYLQKPPHEPLEGAELAMVEAIRPSLERSYQIWLTSSGSSREAKKAVEALSVILDNHGTGTRLYNTNHLDADNSQPPVANADNYPLDGFADFTVQFPVFDTAFLTSWTPPTTHPPENTPVSMSASNTGWQMPDNALRWPWDDSSS